jgi:hypothetical protein
MALSAAIAEAAVPPLTIAEPSPSGRLAVAPMTDVDFSARVVDPVEQAYVRVSDSPADAEGELLRQVAGGQMAREPFSERMSWHLPVVSSMRANPGTYWWQVVALVRNERGTLEEAFGPVQRVDMYFPAAWSRRGPIDRRFGRHGRAHFLLSTRALPSGLDPARFRFLAAQSARRWGLHLDGWTSRASTARDHVNVVGFGPVPVAGALAVQRDGWDELYRSGRFVGRVLTDQDLITDPSLEWAQGPARPTSTEYDLESVLIHELGHLAGNHRHAKLCSNSPMGPVLGPGEWWHTPHDWYRRGCAHTQPGRLL